MICKNCRSFVEDGSKFCSVCGCDMETGEVPHAASAPVQQPVVQPVTVNSSSNANFVKRCPRCGSTNIQYQAVAEQKKRGCLSSLIWVILAICTIGIILLIPLLTKKGSKTRTYAVCQTCGHRWRA